jgi:hypothetical protein
MIHQTMTWARLVRAIGPPDGRLRWSRAWALACGGLLLVLGVSLPAAAQDQPPQDPAGQDQAGGTRAGLLRRAREERQTSPYKPNGLERAVSVVEDRLQPLLVRDGVHWKLGSLTTGSGFAYGGGYRHRRLFDGEGAFSVWAAASLKGYWALEGRFALPDLADGHLSIGGYVRHSDYPQESFFGLGGDSRRSDHTSFDLRNTRVGGDVGVKPWRTLTIGGNVEFLRPRVRNGTNTRIPAIGDLFDGVSAPGLGSEENFVRVGGFVDLDYRQPKNARRGGWYRLELSRYDDRSGAFDFNRVEADVRQYVSAFSERRVLALRLFASTSDAESGSSVPFYLMRSLGGYDSLRGFRDYRFRGPHALLTQVEYRYEIWSGFDAALLYDAGKVTDRRADLNFKRLEHNYGIGFRLNTDNGVILRVDTGFGSRDGKHLFIVFGDAF